jgi:hypothetical protein
MYKKALFTFLTLGVLTSSFLSFLVPSAKAQGGTGPWYNQTFPQWYTKVYDDTTNPPTEIFGERYTAAQVQWIIYGLGGFILAPIKPLAICWFGADVVSCFKQLTDANTPGQPVYANESHSFSTFLGEVFNTNRPLSLIGYTRNIGEKIHIVPTAYAQNGFGYGALDVVRSLWSSARDITYGLFILIIIVMAFMIMFRTKISPQAVITVQSALPKVVITLILVTFSYAIAGLFVDLMFVVTGLLSLIISSAGYAGFTDPTNVFKWLTNGTITIGIPIVDSGIIGMLSGYLMLFTFALGYDFIVGGGIFSIILAPIAVFNAGIGVILSLVAFIILFIVFIIAGIKILWMLIKTFANVLLLTIVAPIQIAFGAVMPSTGMGFASWAKNYLANLLVFPIAGFFMTLAYIFAMASIGAASASFTDPNNLPGFLRSIPIISTNLGLNSAWPPLLNSSAGLAQGQITSLLLLATSLMIILMTPKTAEIVKGLVAGKPFAYGTAIGQAFSPITGPVSGVMGEGKKYAYGQGASYVRGALSSILAKKTP